MRSSVLLSTVCCIALASCAGQNAVVPGGAAFPAPVDALPSRAAVTSPLLYVSDHIGKAMDVYDVSGAKARRIGGFQVPGNPTGVALAPHNKVYIAWQNTAGAGVGIYPAGSGTPSSVIELGTDSTGSVIQPSFITAAPDGTFYVSRYHGFDAHQIGDVAQYKPNSPKPIRKIVLPTNLPGGQTDSPLALGTTLDKQGNLYVAWVENDSRHGHVMKVPPGSTKGTDLGYQINFPGSILFDRHGNMIVDVQCCTINQILVARAGTTDLQPFYDFGSSDPFCVVFSPDKRSLWVSSAANPDGLFKISYPRGNLEYFLQLPYTPWGIAFVPGPFNG